jgi:glycosyltransferase involved in cell wall biosynthesis
LYLGRLYALKGVHDLLEAVSRLRNKKELEVILAGSLTDRDYVNSLRDTARRLGIDKNIEFRGILSMDAVLEELSICSCLVLPSYQETAPMVIQEAMASGVPVIASDICGIPYQVDNNDTGFLFTPGVVDELAERLDSLLSDSALRMNFGSAARLRATKEYHADAVARRTLRVYREVVDQS